MHVNKAILLGGKASPSRASVMTLAVLGAAIAVQGALAPITVGLLDPVFDLFLPGTKVEEEAFPVSSRMGAITIGRTQHLEAGLEDVPLPAAVALPSLDQASPVSPPSAPSGEASNAAATQVQSKPASPAPPALVAAPPASSGAGKPAMSAAPAKVATKPSPIPAKSPPPKTTPVLVKAPPPKPPVSKPSAVPQAALPPSCSVPFSSGRALSVSALGVRSLTPGVLVYVSADVSCRLVPGAVLSGGEKIIRVDADRLRVETDKRVIQLIDD